MARIFPSRQQKWPDPQYLQIVEAYRNHGRTTQRVVANLGRLDHSRRVPGLDDLLVALSQYARRPVPIDPASKSAGAKSPGSTVESSGRIPPDPEVERAGFAAPDPAVEMAGFAAPDPAVEMAGFESFPFPENPGADSGSANRMYRETVSRSMPSSRAIRRRDQP